MFDVDTNGIIMYDAQDWKQDLLDSVYIPAFGGDLDIDATAPIGALLNADVALGMKVQSALGELANCNNPFSATGANLTKIGNSFGYIRRQNSPAHASVVFQGTTGLTVPAGFELEDDAGNKWTTDNATTIGEYVSATCKEKGTEIPPNFINKLVSVLNGVDSVSQPTAGVDGYVEESDAEMSKRMTATGYAGRGRGTLGAIASAISNVDGVYGISFTENPGSDTITWRGKQLVRNSIYFCVAGGADEDIARAIAITKTNGCSTNGSVEIYLNDPENTSNSYTYYIDRPRFQEVYVRLISKSDVDLSSSLPLFKKALNDSQRLNAFPLGGEMTAVNVIDRTPQDLTNLGIIGCDISTNGTTWVKDITAGADVILQIPDAKITIKQGA